MSCLFCGPQTLGSNLLRERTACMQLLGQHDYAHRPNFYFYQGAECKFCTVTRILNSLYVQRQIVNFVNDFILYSVYIEELNPAKLRGIHGPNRFRFKQAYRGTGNRQINIAADESDGWEELEQDAHSNLRVLSITNDPHSNITRLWICCV